MRICRSLHTLARCVFIALFTLVAVAPARADGPRVAVLPFEGSEAIAARVALQGALEDGGVEVVPLSRAASAARRARVRGLSRRRLERALELAEADATLQGHTEVRHGEVELRVILVSADGDELLDRELSLEDLDELAGEVQQALGRPRPAARTVLASRYEASEPSERSQGEPGASRGRERAAARRSAAEEHTDLDATELPWLVAAIGASARMRDASFDAADGARFYRAWYPSIDLAAELRPFHREGGPERGLFFRASFYHSLGLRSRGPNDTVLDTAFFGLAADGGLLVAVASDWEVGFSVGLGLDAFELADGPATLVPTALYGSLRPGLRARAQLLDELVVLDVGAGYRWVFERGPIASAYGRQGESHGFEVGATLGGSVDVGFSWAVSADVVGVASQFHGDADLVAASGGRDLALRFGARVGLALR